MAAVAITKVVKASITTVKVGKGSFTAPDPVNDRSQKQVGDQASLGPNPNRHS